MISAMSRRRSQSRTGTILWLLAVVLLLSACLGKVDQRPSLLRTSESFAEAMRWSDYRNAARFMRLPASQLFLEKFADEVDLHIVDSQIVDLQFSADQRRADVIYRMEYYRLPSTRLQTWTWTQQWTLPVPQGDEKDVWLIESAPVTLPWEE